MIRLILEKNSLLIMFNQKTKFKENMSSIMITTKNFFIIRQMGWQRAQLELQLDHKWLGIL
jgi:hypothetical protein